MTERRRVGRALISVSDKRGVVAFAERLATHGPVQIISTGGTLETLRAGGVEATDVAEVTGHPEMMGGRVKTLHPHIHGAILGRLPGDAEIMDATGITPIDLVCVNLYPFEQTTAAGATAAEAIEQIDIGGPCLIRAAAKNHARVVAVVDPSQYDDVLAHLRDNDGSSTPEYRQRLAATAFRRTCEYDLAIADHLAAATGTDRELRYGENPHQRAWLRPDVRRPDEASVAHAVCHGDKALSYINFLDADAALAVVKEFESHAACIVKHATPCGVGRGDTGGAAFARAFEGDPLAAFGGVVALNTAVDGPAAEEIVSIGKFIEVIVAPAFDDDAIARLRDRWKNVRLLDVGPIRRGDGAKVGLSGHRLFGGEVVQDRDVPGVDCATWHTVSKRVPTDAELEAMRFNWIACKHVKSNAVVIGGADGTYGIGGGQVDRVAAAAQAVEKADMRARGAVAASDAFFPFPDGPEALLHAGVTAIVQPGGSVRDRETIDLVDRYGAAMIFTGRRHFRH